MKADFEKGTKICSKCKRELPIEMFNKDKIQKDGLYCSCKESRSNTSKISQGRRLNVFSRNYKMRGNSGMIKRDYELTDEQLKRRNNLRKKNRCKIKNKNPHGVLIYYDGKLDNLTSKEYSRAMQLEYKRQVYCAIRGYIGKIQPSEHFVFDFDLEQMLKDKIYYSPGGRKVYITKWWKGEIRHWTVNDGIWKE